MYHTLIPMVHIHNLRLGMADFSLVHKFDSAKSYQRAIAQHYTSQLLKQWYKVGFLFSYFLSFFPSLCALFLLLSHSCFSPLFRLSPCIFVSLSVFFSLSSLTSPSRQVPSARHRPALHIPAAQAVVQSRCFCLFFPLFLPFWHILSLSTAHLACKGVALSG